MYYLGALKKITCVCVCVCVYEWGMGDPLTTAMQVISNATPACCNQDSFFFCVIILKFSSGKKSMGTI